MSVLTSPPLHLWLRLGFLSSRERLLDASTIHNVRAREESLRISYAAEFVHGDRGAIVYVHGGWWKQYDMFALPKSVQSIAIAHELTILSVSYRLFSQGSTLDEMRDDLRVAWEFAEARYPHVPKIAMGSSAGGTLVLDATRSGLFRPDGLIVDSSSNCIPKIAEDVMDSKTSAWARTNGEMPNLQDDSPIPRLRSMCFDEWTPPVPALVLHSEKDIIVPIVQARRWSKSGAANLTLLVSSRGQHMACLDPWVASSTQEWMEKVLSLPPLHPSAYWTSLADVLFSEMLRSVPSLEILALCNTHPFSRWIHNAFCR